MIILPTEKTKPLTENPGLVFLYGLPKVGKSSSLSQLEGNLIIDLERGSKFLNALKIEVNSLSELIEVGGAIKKANYPYKYISIDTVDKLEEWCEVEATDEYRSTTIGKSFDGKSILELPQGAGYY